MKFHFQIALFLSIVALSITGQAQVDPSSALLLKPTSDAPNTQNTPDLNLDSGRYTIRPRPTTNVEKSNSRTNVENTNTKTNAEKSNVQTVKQTSSSNTTQGSTPSKSHAGEGKKSESVTDPSMTTNANEGLPDRIRDFFIGGEGEDILRYRQSLHPEDSRQNITEVYVAPSLIYVDANSTYWYRNFYSSGPGLNVGARFWLTPFFGLQTNYFTSFAADMTSSPTSTKKINTDHRLLNAGIQFRRFFSKSRKSPSISVGLGFDEYQLLVPRTEAERPRLKHSGVNLRLEALIPTTLKKAWFYGVEMTPKVKVDEQKTGLALKSGERPNTFSVKFSIGNDYTFSRRQTVFWRLSHRLDKTVYEGDANEVDPVTQTIPSGVSVTQGMTMFQLGFTWAD